MSPIATPTTVIARDLRVCSTSSMDGYWQAMIIPESSKDIGREIRLCCCRLQMRWHFTGSGSPLITRRSSRTGMPGPVPTYCWSREFDSTRKLFADAIMESVAVVKATGVDLPDDYLAKQR